MDSEINDPLYCDVIIVGAGVSGINAAQRLQTLAPPGTTYKILEARDSIGGTWDLFRYPGIRSDSDIFSYAFPWSPWYRKDQLAPGEDIKEYIIQSANSFGIGSHIRYRHKVVSANWCPNKHQWELVVLEDDNNNQPHTYRCQFIFLGTGFFNYQQARQTVIPGIENFEGQVLHPQFWPENLDCSDKEVVIIGNGATAISIVPALATSAKVITMLQRSPGYIWPLQNRNFWRDLFFAILPAWIVFQANRILWILLTCFSTILFDNYPDVMRKRIRDENIRLLPENVPWDPHFNPRYNPMDQRLCVSEDNDIFTALRSGKARVVTDTIKTVTKDSIQLNSGAELPADLIITATGLNVLFAGGIKFTIDKKEFNPPEKFVWKAAMVQDLPNVVFALGYLKNGSWTLGSECTIQLLIRLIKELKKRKRHVVTPYLRDDDEQMQPKALFGLLKSNYLLSSDKEFPQTGSGIWCNRINYISDLWDAKWGDIETSLKYD